MGFSNLNILKFHKLIIKKRFNLSIYLYGWGVENSKIKI